MDTASGFTDIKAFDDKEILLDGMGIFSTL